MSRFTKANLERMGDVIHGRAGYSDAALGDALKWAAAISSEKYPGHASTSLGVGALCPIAGLGGRDRFAVGVPAFPWRGEAVGPLSVDVKRAGTEGAASTPLLDAAAEMPALADAYPPERPAKWFGESLRRRVSNARAARRAGKRLASLHLRDAESEGLGAAFRPLFDAMAPKLHVYGALMSLGSLAGLIADAKAQNATDGRFEVGGVSRGEEELGDWVLDFRIGPRREGADDQVEGETVEGETVEGMDLVRAIDEGRKIRQLTISTELSDAARPRPAKVSGVAG